MPRQLTDEFSFVPQYASEYLDEELTFLRSRLIAKIDRNFTGKAVEIATKQLVWPIDAEIARREAKKREQE